ncbi:MAG: sigma-70 family RNA polymerase sigma factor [Ruminococcaceae bacterium]|nr:sigma-70 family RNA polymerase sigma factor [Oscillospiraceae bacterium]
MEDHQIVDLYWQRSENAIAETDRKYGRMLSGISLSLVPTAQDADECLSDTYLAAWNSMPSERPQYLGAFLSKIIRRISIDKYRALRAQKREGTGIFVDELTDCIPDGYDLESALSHRQLTALLNDFLYSQEGEKRYIFVRRYYYGDSIAEIARRTHMGEGKIKTVLFRLRNALKKRLEKEGWTP